MRRKDLADMPENLTPEGAGRMTLERLILTFKPGELVMHVLYGGADPDGPRPNTKTRGREALDLTRAGLTEALKILEREDGIGIECVGTSGFTRKEDVFVALPRPDEPTAARRSAS